MRAASGLMEPLAAALSAGMVGPWVQLLPWGPAIAAGTMLCGAPFSKCAAWPTARLHCQYPDRSGRTEQAASSLQQAAGSTEELTGAVVQTAESARTASQLAGAASEVAAQGGVMVGRVVATMDEIRSGSRGIGDIDRHRSTASPSRPISWP